MQKDQPLVKIIYTEDYDLENWGELTPATDGSAGFDIRACTSDPVTLIGGNTLSINTGIKIHINDPRYAAILLPRSGLGSKGLVLANTVGLIDSDYQGAISAVLWNRNNIWGAEFTVNRGDKIAQLVLVPVILPHFEKVDSFESTRRGEGGFGHTGR